MPVTLRLPRRARTRQAPFFAAVLLTLVCVGGVDRAAANTIEEIEWTTDRLGRTLVSVTTSEPFETAPYRTYPVSDPPRLVVVIQGITDPVSPSTIAVDDRNVHRIRLGHHRERTPPELHLVFDLTSDTVEVIELRHRETRLDLVLGSPDGAAPTSTPSSTRPPLPTDSPTPTETPTFAPSPTASQPHPDRPAPPVIPAARTEPTPRAVRTTAPPASVQQIFATPTPVAVSPVASHVIDLAATPRGDGSTLLRVTGDGDFPKGCARHLEVTDDPPRIVLTIRDVSAPDLPRSIDVGGQNIVRIRLVHDAEVSQGELHLVLHLTDPDIEVTDLRQLGPNLVLQLSRTE